MPTATDGGSAGDGEPLTLGGTLANAPLPDASVTAPPLSETIDPQGLHSVLTAAKARFPLLPLYVTVSLNENALPDVQRPAYLVQAVAAVQQDGRGRDRARVLLPLARRRLRVAGRVCAAPSDRGMPSRNCLICAKVYLGIEEASCG